ncbi:MAG TPA: tRNA lysidine(34) synthetase TilS [Steroidobacteraceae bacterium]|nr:tRNA lysidine(34) synthetase TilS [Steroidobacteraceae bacterium]
MRFLAPYLLKQLRSILPSDTRELCVGFSGGLDSTVLLCALAEIRSESDLSVRAIHVNHGLQADAASWAARCEQLCDRLGIPLGLFSVSVQPSGEGVEAAARNARYNLFRSQLREREVLLTAHHADDQLETLLLALVRGSGVRGLASMPFLQPLGRGFHCRPLLEVDREALYAWARAQCLEWVEDVSNQNPSFDRNYLRHAVVPALRRRWPAIAQAAARTAQHLGEAAVLLDELAARDLGDVSVDRCLHVRRLEDLASARRRNVLRAWLRQYGARAPSARKLAAIEHDILHAAFDRTPCIECDGVSIRRHRDLLYCTRPMPPVPKHDLAWNPQQPLHLAELGALVAHLDSPSANRQWVVRFREGGEAVPVGAHHQKLKHLLQQQKVLPWWRSAVPLIYEADELLAVGDLWVHPGAQVLIRWEDRPDLVARSTED